MIFGRLIIKSNSVIKSKAKIFILLTDGVSLRNFAYTSFYGLATKNFDVVFWNTTLFDLNSLNISNIQINNPRLHWYTDILKSACKKIELKLFSIRDNDSIYFQYDFPLAYKSIKGAFKNGLIFLYSKLYGSEKGLLKIRSKIIRNEQKTNYYKECLKVLKSEKPDFVFCTSQRSGIAIAPLAAASDLDIPTASFIFSWDNIPKATTVVTTNFYFVWSDLMKNQLLHYQRYIRPEQIKITGTPQFENHYITSLQESKEVFFKKHGLDLNKKYICFSGDDITTSPKDELYLRDVAEAIRKLNKEGQNLGVIFRRCPVDFSDRYDLVINDYKDIIVPIAPLWEKIDKSWNTIMPTFNDLKLQTNIISHTEFVVNLGSSMVFDYVSYDKPCAFINYNYLSPLKKLTKGVYVYDYVHFRSMPSSMSVVWLSNPDEISENIKLMLNGVPKTIDLAKKWFKVINKQPPMQASERILSAIKASIKINGQ